jgi:hypothetical protein
VHISNLSMIRLWHMLIMAKIGAYISMHISGKGPPDERRLYSIACSILRTKLLTCFKHLLRCSYHPSIFIYCWPKLFLKIANTIMQMINRRFKLSKGNTNARTTVLDLLPKHGK